MAYVKIFGILILSAGLLAAILRVPTLSSAEESDSAAQAAIRAALSKWTKDFNTGNSSEVCKLFAPDLIATFAGHADRNYGSQCNDLLRALRDPTKTYTYSPDIQEIIVSGDLAVARLVWTTQVQRSDGAGAVTTKEPSMDVFRRQPDGSWKISRYLAFEAPQ